VKAKSSAVIVLAGPNGAGKSTTALELLKGALAVADFVNPDTIAQGLSAFAPERIQFAAGRIMVSRLHELAQRRATFAFETTLASRSFAPWLKILRSKGYRVHLVFLWLASANLAVKRVQDRVRLGGHNVPEVDIRRRYVSGLRNFFHLYLPLTSTWRFYDNSDPSGPRLIARGKGVRTTAVIDERLWAHIAREAKHAC
jgi:predicted ABC-type ATPase